MTNFDVYLADAKTVAIAGHVRPDGDCAGSCLATYNYIKNCINSLSKLIKDPSFAQMNLAGLKYNCGR